MNTHFLSACSTLIPTLFSFASGLCTVFGNGTMPLPVVDVSIRGFAKVIAHLGRHVTSSVSGILVGEVIAMEDTNHIRISLVDVFPLFHISATSRSILEASCSLVEEWARGEVEKSSRNLHVIGYYACDADPLNSENTHSMHTNVSFLHSFIGKEKPFLFWNIHNTSITPYLDEIPGEMVLLRSSTSPMECHLCLSSHPDASSPETDEENSESLFSRIRSRLNWKNDGSILEIRKAAETVEIYDFDDFFSDPRCDWTNASLNIV